MATIKLGDDDIHTLGELPAVGSAAPEFNLTDSEFGEVKLSDYAGRKVILNIFPSIATGICAMSTRKFNEAADARDDVTIVTVSHDLPFPLQNFKAAEGIDAAVMTSAFRSDFGQDYQATIADGPWRGLLSRAVVVLDADHEVVYTEQVPAIGSEPNYEAALNAVDEA